MPTRAQAFIDVRPTGSVSIFAWRDSQAQRVELQTQVQAVGAYEAIGASSLDGILVSGRDGTGGRLEYWAKQSGTWALNSILSLAGADFSGVAYDGTSLFVLDCASKTILRGLWNPASPVDLIQLSVFATQTELPQLANAGEWFLEIAPLGSLPGASSPELVLMHEFQSTYSRKGISVREVLGQIQSSPTVRNLMPVVVGAVADETSAWDGGLTLDVHVSPNTSFVVENEQLMTIATGVGGARAGLVQVALSEPLEIGKRYAVRVYGAAQSNDFVCMRRHGFPEVFSHGVSMSRIRLTPQEYRSGNLLFGIKCGLFRTSNDMGEHDYFGGMLLGLQEFPIIPFDNGSGLNSLLVTEFWVGALGRIADGAPTGLLSMTFPLVGNPSLEGIVILGQFVALEESGFRLSEVVGFKVQPPQ
ncbi:MAG: hypothetical protein IM674_01330 [Brevundimonas sp.]|nr:hypothetical protein [Brevundimonas sp.]